MSRFILLLLIQSLLSLSLHAQDVHGLVTEGGIPVKDATVVLYRTADTTALRSGITGADGGFGFSGLNPGAYFVTASFTGFAPANSEAFTLAQASLNVGELKMTRAAGALTEVVVTSRKRLVDARPEKIVLNIEGTVNALGSTALDLLRKAPGVVLDKDDLLQLNGSAGVTVHIDGRPSPLSGKELAAYLQSLQSSQIEAIEIIASPSARYDAGGTGGIVNLRLKKNKLAGFNLGVNGGWGIGTYGKYHAGTSVSYRNQKFQVYGSFTYGSGLNVTRLGTDRHIGDSAFLQNGSSHLRDNSFNLKSGVDIYLNKNSSFGVLLNGSFSGYSLRSDNLTTIAGATTGATDRLLRSGNGGALSRDNFGVNLNYSLGGRRARVLTLNADYHAFRQSDELLQPNHYLHARTLDTLASRVYAMRASATIDIVSAKADFEESLFGGTIGAGVKLASVRSGSGLHSYAGAGLTAARTLYESNRFLYREQIGAGYVNFQKTYRKVSLQAGLRLEHTATRGQSTGLEKGAGGLSPFASAFTRSYTGLFGNLLLGYTLNAAHTFTLSYGRRIDRPNYQNLNPFGIGIDEYIAQRGNPGLMPQYAGKIGITHSYKGKLTSTLTYTSVKGKIISLIDSMDVSKATITKANVASERVLNLSSSYVLNYRSYSLTANAGATYRRLAGNLGAGRAIDLDAFGIQLQVQNVFRLNDAWTADLSGLYKSPFVDGSNLRTAAMWSLDAGIQRKIFKGSGSVKASVSDLFNSLEVYSVSEFAGQRVRFSKKAETRQFKLSFILNLGNKQLKPRPAGASGAEEETRRV